MRYEPVAKARGRVLVPALGVVSALFFVLFGMVASGLIPADLVLRLL